MFVDRGRVKIGGLGLKNAMLASMTRKHRISSPKVFETVLTKSSFFRKHDWLFDTHPGIVSSFQPDVRITFDPNAALAGNEFGHISTIDRQLVAHPDFALFGSAWSLAELETETYATTSNDDDAFLFVVAPDGTEAQLRPSKVFRGNDVLAAELAVKLNIGYSALPEFLLSDHISKPEIYRTFFKGWRVSPTYLRIESSGPPDTYLSDIQKALLNALTPLVKSQWRPFGKTQNIVSMVCSK